MKHAKKARLSSILTGIKCVIFVLALTAGLVLNIVIDRPEKSESENRVLNKAPSFSWDKLWSGEFFSKESADPNEVGVSQWFADTVPFRESLVTAQRSLEGLYGIRGTEIHGDVGKGDDIPDAPMTSRAVSSAAVSSEAASSGYQEITVSEAPDDGTGATPETLGGILILGDSAYEYYNFSQSAADTYIGAVTRFADKMAGKAKVYDVVIPTSIAITVPASVKNSINSSNQLKAINYIYQSMSSLSGNVTTVDVYSTLYEHRNDYVYFRTDHHWTPTGAYYAYRELMKAVKKKPVELSYYGGDLTRVFGGFLGTFYKSTKSAALAANPDTVTAYIPKGYAMTKYQADGITVDRPDDPDYLPIIRDPSQMDAGAKYWYTFIGGDHALGCLHKTGKEPGAGKKICVLVKESYGNCFAPLLCAHYDEVWVVDYRYLKGSLQGLVERVGATDVFFLNNTSATRNTNLMKDLSTLVDIEPEPTQVETSESTQEVTP